MSFLFFSYRTFFVGGLEGGRERRGSGGRGGFGRGDQRGGSEEEEAEKKEMNEEIRGREVVIIGRFGRKEELLMVNKQCGH